MSQSGVVHVAVEKVERETPAAFLLRIDGERVWVPKSQIADPDTYAEGDEGLTVSLTEWIARQKGIEGDN